MLTTQSFTVYKDAIPASCFAVGGKVRARITGINGANTLDNAVDTAYSGTPITPTGSITLYDSTGTAYKVACVAA